MYILSSLCAIVTIAVLVPLKMQCAYSKALIGYNKSAVTTVDGVGVGVGVDDSEKYNIINISATYSSVNSEINNNNNKNNNDKSHSRNYDNNGRQNKQNQLPPLSVDSVHLLNGNQYNNININNNNNINNTNTNIKLPLHATSANQTDYLHYELLPFPTVNITSSTLKPIPPGLLATLPSVDWTNVSRPGFINNLPVNNFTLLPPNAGVLSTTVDNNSTATETDDAFDTTLDIGFNLGGSWNNNTLSQMDVESYLMRYESDGGTHCLLDDLKVHLMWWSYENGTLFEENLQAKIRHGNYMDLSYKNFTQDDRLYSRVKFMLNRSKNKYPMLVFSVAYNNLTSAPYKTLTLMNDTLMYLSLKGNQFAACNTEKQVETLTRIINETYNLHDYDDSYESIPNYYGPNVVPLPTKPIYNITVPHNKEHHPNPTHHQNHLNQPSQPNQPNTSNQPNQSKPPYSQPSPPNKHTPLHPEDESPEVSGPKPFKELGIMWATFPHMPALLELDISNCHIEYVSVDVFVNLTNLRRLFMSHNKMLTIPSDAFQHVAGLEYLDLSHTNVLDYDYHIPMPTVEVVVNLIYGVNVQQFTFKYLPELLYLDLSHTKVTRNSAMAFTHLGDKLKLLSLCYTAFPMLGNAFFKNTRLLALDMSGNAYAAYNIIEDAFEGVADTLQYLYFESSNIKDIEWLQYLENLKVLGLAGNNINSLTLETFSSLRSLQILDLNSNHIGNWYNSVFSENTELRVLDLRDNNINIITSEMLRDFETLDYLSLGANDFVCDCQLKDIVEVGAANNRVAECRRNVLQEVQPILNDNWNSLGRHRETNWTALQEQVFQRVNKTFNNVSIALMVDAAAMVEFEQHLNTDYEVIFLLPYARRMQHSEHNLREYRRKKGEYRMRFSSPKKTKALISKTNTTDDVETEDSGNSENSENSTLTCTQTDSMYTYSTLNGSTLKFQLLDYEEDEYWCFNGTQRLTFVQLQCQARAYTTGDDITETLHKLTTSVVASICSIIGVILLIVLIYFKRWHILYYYSSLRSAALVSVAAKESADKFNVLAEQDPNLVYDIFISYCQNDRQWVLEELLPNVEDTGDISICMHERDFQIGLTILDNIISCMDRSRALMLIISSNFLLSHWCQFEMHLAQHRILEVSKDHLILVFLEDIPRSKRPRTLQYLMEVKTYIKWPSANGNKHVKPEERKLFWKRLKRSLEHIGVSATESSA